MILLIRLVPADKVPELVNEAGAELVNTNVDDVLVNAVDIAVVPGVAVPVLNVATPPVAIVKLPPTTTILPSVPLNALSVPLTVTFQLLEVVIGLRVQEIIL